MARIRTIKPDFFLDEDLAALPAVARLAFIGLWTLADREGRLEDRPRKIFASLFPYEPKLDAEGILTSLAGGGWLVRYAAEGRAYIQIRTFAAHQRPNLREPESTIPAPNPDTCKHVPARASTCKVLHDTPQRRREREGEGEIEGEGNGKGSPSPQGDDFAAFWSAYPRKVGKAAALAAWRKRKPPLDAVLAALSWQTGSIDWTREGGKYIPHPTTYLSQGRWEDEPQAPVLVGYSERELRGIQAGQAWLRRKEAEDAARGDAGEVE